MAFGTGYIDNGDGTYTLEEVRHIKKTEWRSYCYYGYNYVCMDNNETCSDIKSMSSTDNEKFYYRGMDESIDFGKNVTYDVRYIPYATIFNDTDEQRESLLR